MPYGAQERAQAVAIGKSLDLLIKQYPTAETEIEELLSRTKAEAKLAKFLPVRAKNDAVAIIGEDGSLLGFLPYDGYF